jgi:8-oxo-dGTP diphosphatase
VAYGGYAALVTSAHPDVARCRLSAGVLFLDAAGRALLVKPTYKPGWEIPGGFVEPGESPLSGCQRELKEELGRAWPVHPHPLVVDWTTNDHGDILLFVFDGGTLDDDDVKAMVFADGEISEARFVEPAAFDQHLPPGLARRLRLAHRARAQQRGLYAEHATEAERPTG